MRKDWGYEQDCTGWRTQETASCPEREVRDLPVGRDQASHAARSCGAVGQWGVDRSTVTHICKVAKQGNLDALAASVPGRRGRTVEQVGLEAAQAEIERLKSTVTEQAVSLHLVEGKSLWE